MADSNSNAGDKWGGESAIFKRQAGLTDGGNELAYTDSQNPQRGGRQMTRKDGKSRMDMLDWNVESQSQDGGRLNPTWVGWLMGFPTEWASLKDSGMLKSRCKQPQHTDYSEASK